MKKSWNFLNNYIFHAPFSQKVPLSNIIPKSLLTLQFLKCLISQNKAYIQGFQMMYQSFLSHWYPKRYSWFSDLQISTFHLFWQPLYLAKRFEKANIKYVCTYVLRLFNQKTFQNFKEPSRNSMLVNDLLIMHQQILLKFTFCKISSKC